MTKPRSTPPALRLMGPVNWIGLWGLCCKEVRRFISIYVQTVAAPIITTLLFLVVFSLALDRAGKLVGGVPFQFEGRR